MDRHPQGLAVWTGVMGERHYDVRIFGRNIAEVLLDLGRADEAQLYLDQAALAERSDAS